MATFVGENSTELLNKQTVALEATGAVSKASVTVKAVVSLRYKEGYKILAQVGDWKNSYKGTITRANADGTYAVLFDDGEKVEKVQPSEIKSVVNSEKDIVVAEGISASRAKQVGKCTSEYTVSFDDDNAKKSKGGSSQMTLQERFNAMRRKKLAESKHANYVRRRGQRSKERKDKLRKDFIAQVKKYIGVPYAQKYHEKGTEAFESPIFLDCCALIRRAQNDLAEDFGFLLGRWNQNYQMSTLPEVAKFEDLKEGDLIFYEAAYYNPEKAKKQRLDLVHVEMFYPGKTGRGTIGSRWQKGRVQEFDSYEFTSKNYHSVKHHFRSIDRWLDGECTPSHDFWPVNNISNMATNKYSMFNAENLATSESADGTEDSVSLQNVRKRFYVGQGNGWKMIADSLFARGDWIQVPFDQGFSQNYHLKWVERRSEIDFATLKENNQIANHISNNDVITTKKGLMEVLNFLHNEEFIDISFFPTSYDFTLASDRLEFLSHIKGKGDYVAGVLDPWIVKPIAMNRGRGIKIYKNAKPICNELLGGRDLENCGGIDKWNGSNALNGFICQKYLTNPLLIDGKKFDIRVYCLVSECHSEQFMAFYAPGYLRMSLEKYTNTDFTNQFVHLNNIAIQKNHKDYRQRREESIWNFDQLNSYLNEKGIGEKDWALNGFQHEMKRIMSILLVGASKSLERKKGTFDLLGFDFMVDADLNVKLIEVNTNPALHKNDGKWLQTLFPKLVTETLDIVLKSNELDGSEMFEDAEESSGKPEKIDGLFELIYNEKGRFMYHQQ